jgi:hypothetical protein
VHCAIAQTAKRVGGMCELQGNRSMCARVSALSLCRRAHISHRPQRRSRETRPATAYGDGRHGWRSSASTPTSVVPRAPHSGRCLAPDRPHTAHTAPTPTRATCTGGGLGARLPLARSRSLAALAQHVRRLTDACACVLAGAEPLLSHQPRSDAAAASSLRIGDTRTRERCTRRGARPVAH